MSRDRLIFNMKIPYLGTTLFILGRGPGDSDETSQVVEIHSQ